MGNQDQVKKYTTGFFGGWGMVPGAGLSFSLFDLFILGQKYTPHKKLAKGPAGSDQAGRVRESDPWVRYCNFLFLGYQRPSERSSL